MGIFSRYLPILFILLVSFSACQSVFFFPSEIIVQTPTDLGLRYEDHFIEIEPGIKVHAWELIPEGEEKGVVLLLHGNAENISTHIMSVAWLVKYGYRVYAFDYEGFGRSDGDESVENSVRDAKKVFEFVSSKKRGQPLIVIGQSIGGAIGLFAFSDPKYSEAIKLFVIDSAFSSYQSIAKERLDVGLIAPLPYLISQCATSCCDPIDVISEYKFPYMLFLHDELDPVVSKREGEKLYEKVVASRKEIWGDADGRHISFFNKLKNRERFLRLLEGINPSTGSGQAGRVEEGERGEGIVGVGLAPTLMFLF